MLPREHRISQLSAGLLKPELTVRQPQLSTSIVIIRLCLLLPSMSVFRPTAHSRSNRYECLPIATSKLRKELRRPNFGDELRDR